jgi:hypothetical protein
MKQTEDKPNEGIQGGVQEPRLPISIPMSIIRWAVYTLMFTLLIIPFVQDTRQMICGGLILGHFASQLNALINKK